MLTIMGIIGFLIGLLGLLHLVRQDLNFSNICCFTCLFGNYCGCWLGQYEQCCLDLGEENFHSNLALL